MKCRVALVLAVLATVGACSGGQDRVVVAAGTTLVDSGFIEAVVAVYEMEHAGTEVSIVAQPTALALELGRQGAADLLITHAPGQEAEFVAAGFAKRSERVLSSEFLVVGPANGASLAGLSVERLFAMIAEEGHEFVSRGDESGTYDAEMAIWEQIGIDPSGQSWYSQTGQGMGPTLLVADQRDAFVLAERGAFIEARNEIALQDYAASGDLLANHYTATVVADSRNPTGADQLVSWLLSDRGVKVIAEVDITLFDQMVYRPSATE